MRKGHERNNNIVQFRPVAGRTYIAFNKPYAVLSQFTQPAESDKSTLAEFGFPPDVYPLGRLDYDSEGLLLLSDDGRLNQLLLKPSGGHPRTYLAQVENIPSPEQLALLVKGVVIKGYKTLPASVELLDAEPELPVRPVPVRFRKSIPTAWLKLTLTEGRNRQVRHMTAAAGCPTLRLVRVAIGRLNLFNLGLAPGEWVRLSGEQLLHSLT